MVNQTSFFRLANMCFDMILEIPKIVPLLIWGFPHRVCIITNTRSSATANSTARPSCL